ncbi:methyltransferase domain-containing protein [Reyranella sp. CPCC 100927]|uniref:methyltransferase domain-containing protein n=1 Tax=Reyranella sp. CPCC 100927 TaxID=2599616 RepID=UPI0011B51C95|nr:methyltransferase domain-containing protein [Reyranella sp. CPCC 100927]TWT01218.1 methyltransferase domain-containing protein [Reyranella sp. CPCC 100927]
MADDVDLTTAERLVALWDHLGIATAHVATQIPADIAGLASEHGDRLMGIVLCTPTRLDATPFTTLADRILMVSGDSGPTVGATTRAVERLAGAERVVLAGYDAPGWADVAADRSDELAALMTGFLDRAGARAAMPGTLCTGTARQGVHGGITWRIDGTGPVLVLLPFFLAPSQWAPILPRLAARFTVVTLGGPHLGGVAALEDRARAPSYRAMFGTLIDTMAPSPDAAILDVGCGSGALDRLLAGRRGASHRITAVDTNPFLLREAEALAAAEGLDGRIRFVEGSAEALPFDDGTFTGAYSVTVLEECDADLALAEMMRVVRPGGRVGVIVRAIDMPQWWNLAVPDAIRRKIDTPPQSVGPRGVADASLYRRMRQAGLRDLVCFPTLVTLDRPAGPIWRYREDHVLSLLSSDETKAWSVLRDAAAGERLLFMAHPMHCAVGTRP